MIHPPPFRDWKTQTSKKKVRAHSSFIISNFIRPVNPKIIIRAFFSDHFAQGVGQYVKNACSIFTPS